MDIIQVGLKSLSKSSKTEPWKMTFLVPVTNVEMSVMMNQVEVGPRFSEVLSILEEHQIYPRTITGAELARLGMVSTDSFIIKFLDEVPAHVEISFKTLRIFRNPTSPKVKGELREDPYIYKPTLDETVSAFSIQANEGALPTTNNFNSTIKELGYLVEVTPTKILDGDTVYFNVIKAGDKAAQDDRIAPGKEIKVRFAGMNAPETREHGIDQGLARDEEYCNAYKVDADVAFDIGDESWHYLEDMLKNPSGTILIDVDATLTGAPKTDKYGRFLAAVYLTDASDYFNTSFNALVVNKEMLGTFTSIIPKGEKAAPKAPLAMPYYHFIDAEYSRIPTADWLYDLGIRKLEDSKLGDTIKSTNKIIDGATDVNGATKVDISYQGSISGKEIESNNTIHIKYSNSYDNQIDYMEPLDDRLDEALADRLDNTVRIGDVILTIPPLSIEVNRVSSIRKIKTLRTKSSILIKGGSSATTLTLQLYFHDLDSINGTKVKMHKDMDRNYFMDGLRPLIAQFKKAPFVPIDNTYINDVLNIHAVALVNLSVQTVPGFPHSISAQLVLAKFDHSAYMPQYSYMQEAINYPMFRWYYQEPMRDDLSDDERSPYRTYLKPIPSSGLTNNFKWLTVKEEDLQRRKQAIEDIRQLTNPLVAQERFEDPSTTWTSGGNGLDINTLLGKTYKDAIAAQKVLDQYNRYQSLRTAKRVPTRRDDDGKMMDDDLIKNDSKQYGDLFDEIYGESKDDGDIGKVSHFAPFETLLYEWDTDNFAVTPTAGIVDLPDLGTWTEDWDGAIYLRLYNAKNIELFGDTWIKEKADDSTELTTVVAPGLYIDKLQTIVNRGKDAETQYAQGVKDWYTADAIIKETEGNLELVPAEIKGTLIPVNVTVMYENQFSNIQLQSLESPSFQFLGGQDPYIQVSFEADDEAVTSIRAILEETERFAREYRTGITSGFLGVQNHLMELFGVTTVMPETVQIRTVPGFPGRFQVDMTLCGFDKTQKRTEQLEGISPIYGTKVPDREEREVSNWSEGVDNAIIEMKMATMELYPDLELPTYEELVNVLPYLNANCTVYENRTGGIYVDPDFYMATPQTFREQLRKIKDDPKGHSLQMKDFTGVTMVTNSKATNPLDGEAPMWELLKAQDSRTNRVSSNFSWSGDVTDKDAGTSNEDGITYQSKDIEEYVKNRDKLKDMPSEAEFKAWGLDRHYKSYEDWKKKVNPTELEVYQEIYKLVDSLWVNIDWSQVDDSGSGVYNDKNVDITSTAWQKVTYANYEDLWDAEWNRIASKHPKWVKKGQKKSHATKISSSDYKATKSKVPRERIANIIKAIAHVRSKWNQVFANGIPYLDAQGNACGIMGVPLSSEASSLDVAKRLLWDWRFNMAAGIGHLKQSYAAALKKDGIEYKCRPWEWMITAYGTGSIEGEIKSSFWNSVWSTMQSYYNSYQQMFATPTSPMNLKVMQKRMGYTDHEMGIIENNKDDLIEALLEMGYRTVLEEHWYGDKMDSKEDTKKKLEKKNSSELRKIYDKYIKDNYDSTIDATNTAGGKAGMEYRNAQAMGKANALRALPKGIKETYNNTVAIEDYVEDANPLTNTADPQELFPEMLTDMIAYDHRMRFVRAFPSFQMFIIDEGKWMTNYRLWDNLYGYNAIQSIDVHKSRKIAADTAVIEMTNVYSNLTSRAMDTSYDEWDYKFWDNLVFGNPNEKVLEARKTLLSSMLLQTGARIHLRMGYGSSAVDLPTVFNGTITEMSTGEVIQIVAQGDGLELGNVISGDPDDDNKNFFKVTEPRDLICKLMTSKGNWFADVINHLSDGNWKKDNPLGIQHFGQPAGKEVPEGNWMFFNTDYGESAQNIYSSAGVPTFSQWTMPDGADIPYSFNGTPTHKWLQHGDEMNIVVPFYNNTVWDIVQTLAYCSTDYVAAVHPFEMRSTLFFGKPYWKMAYKYDSRYEYLPDQQAWQRWRSTEIRKPFAQFHMFTSETDIIGNNITASAEDIYTVVIANYDGKQVGPIYADFDIDFDKQRTIVADAQIVSNIAGLDFWTSEKQALYYGMSTLRDYMKDMYKGELVTMGDPTLKPHDICFMNDTMYDMNGNFLIEAVTHHFSQETGFISSIQPDAVVVNDDLAILAVNDWGLTALSKAGAFLTGITLGAKTIKRAIPNWVQTNAIKYGKAGASKAVQTYLANVAKMLPDSDDDVKLFKETLELLKDKKLSDVDRAAFTKDLQSQITKLEGKFAQWEAEGKFKNAKDVDIKGLKSLRSAKAILKSTKEMTAALSDGRKAFKAIRWTEAILGFGGFVNPLSTLAAIGLTVATETINEKYRRKKAMMQAVLMYPLNYQGRQYAAGINGHRGMVVGDPMGKIDSFLSGMGFDGQNGNDDSEWIMDTWNFLTDADNKDYSVSEQDLRDGTWKNNLNNQ